jgi:hypothetical protein
LTLVELKYGNGLLQPSSVRLSAVAATTCMQGEAGRQQYCVTAKAAADLDC